MEKSIYDCIIIGGGISGISFAHYLNTINQNILILEKENRVGGQIYSSVSQHNNDYWRELGSHTCYNSYTHLLSILKEINSEDLARPLDKHSYVLYDNKIRRIFSRLSPLPLLFTFPKMVFIKKTNKTVREYFSPIFGKKNYNTLFTNAFRAVICQPADNYPAEMFLKRRKGRYEEFPRKFTFRKGLTSFIDAVVEKDKLNVKNGSDIISITRKDDLYEIETANGKIFSARNIAFGCNPKESARLMKNIEPALSDLLASIPIFNSESLNVIVKKENLNMPEVAGIISLSDKFMSAVSRDLIKDNNYRSFTFHFEKGKETEQEKINIICKVLNIIPEDILEQIAIQHILPSPRIQHLHMDLQIEEIKQNDSVYILGNYFYGLSLEDCVHRSNDEFKQYKLKN